MISGSEMSDLHLRSAPPDVYVTGYSIILEFLSLESAEFYYLILLKISSYLSESDVLISS